MIAQALARVAIPAEVVHVVIVLEQAVLRDDPGDLRPHVRPQDRRGELRVVVGRELIADIVQQCADDQLLVGAVALRARGGLQRVLRRLTG